MRGGSWPPLLILAAVFLGAFAWQRQRSSFLTIEAMAAQVTAAAQPLGIEPAAALALRAMAGAAVDQANWRATLAAWAEQREALGDELAAVAVFGDRAAAVAARAAAPDAASAWQRWKGQAAAEPGLRFHELRQRFASRRPVQ